MRTSAKTILSAVSAASTQTSASQDMRHYKHIAVQVIAASLDAADGSFVVQGSVDGTNFDDITTSTTLAAGASNQLVLVDDVHCGYVRVVYSEGSNTAGTVTAKIQFNG